MYSASLFTDMFSILLLLVLLLASLLVLTITALKKCRQFKIGDKVPNLRETDKKQVDHQVELSNGIQQGFIMN